MRHAITAIGATAARALAASDWRAAPIDGFADAPYLLAGDEIVWIGANPRAMHPRMVVVDGTVARGAPLVLAAFEGAPWTPSAASIEDRGRFVANAHALRTALVRGDAGDARGLGHLIAGGALPFPLDLARGRIERVEHAVAAHDLEALEAGAIALLGFGTGLTPSGDDFVGGLAFGRRLVTDDRTGWDALVERLVAAAPARTHRIALALFADLARGATYGWLHEIVAALARDAAIESALAPARALAAVGHSSGWDMLAGFFLGVTGAIAPPRTPSSRPSPP